MNTHTTGADDDDRAAIDAEVDRLIAAAINDDWSDDLTAAWHWVRTDRAARQRYLRGMALVASLQWNASGDAQSVAVPADHGAGDAVPPAETGAAPEPEPPLLTDQDPVPAPAVAAAPRKTPVVRLLGRMRLAVQQPIAWSTLAVAAIFYGTFVLISANLRPQLAGRPAARQHDVEQLQPPATVAHLTDGGRAVWAAGSEPPDPQAELKSGQTLELARGVAELTFVSGAQVAIEGPATLTLDSENHASLLSGKLTANVPERAIGFSVQTPNLLVVDLGTTFGVEVSRSGDDQVHVFQGEVELQFRGPDERQDRQKPVRLLAGQALRIDKRQLTTEPVVMDTGRFFAAEPEAQRQQRIDLPIEAAYVAAIKRALPVAYWRFEEVVDDRYVRNEMSHDWKLRLCGQAALGGPWGYRRAVFADDGQDRWFQTDAPIDSLEADYTLELFVKPGKFHEGDMISLIVPATSSRGLRFFKGVETPENLARFQNFVVVEFLQSTRQEFTPNSIRFLHRDPPGIDGGENVFSRQPYRPGHWQHVVAAKQGRELRLYVDGMLAETSAAARSEISVNPLLVVGRLFGEGMQTARQGSRQFSGQIDEIAIYARALAEKEIQEHYRRSGVTTNNALVD